MRRTHGTGAGHPPGCFGCHVLTVELSPAGRPADVAEKAMGRDIDAYKALRRDGAQPASVTGCHRLEATATSVAEVESRPDVDAIRERVFD